MPELEQVEQDILTLQESLQIATLALADASLSAQDRSRWQASVDLYERHLAELRIERDDLRSLAEE
jgi:hypothetical protein